MSYFPWWLWVLLGMMAYQFSVMFIILIYWKRPQDQKEKHYDKWLVWYSSPCAMYSHWFVKAIETPLIWLVGGIVKLCERKSK